MLQPMVRANSRLTEQKWQTQGQNKTVLRNKRPSQWVGWLGQKKDGETLCGHIAGEMADQTRDIT